MCAVKTQLVSLPQAPQAASSVAHTQHLLLTGSSKGKKKMSSRWCYEHWNYELPHLFAINSVSSTFFSLPGSNWAPSLKEDWVIAACNDRPLPVFDSLLNSPERLDTLLHNKQQWSTEWDMARLWNKHLGCIPAAASIYIKNTQGDAILKTRERRAQEKVLTNSLRSASGSQRWVLAMESQQRQNECKSELLLILVEKKTTQHRRLGLSWL